MIWYFLVAIASFVAGWLVACCFLSNKVKQVEIAHKKLHQDYDDARN